MSIDKIEKCPPTKANILECWSKITCGILTSAACTAQCPPASHHFPFLPSQSMGPVPIRLLYLSPLPPCPSQPILNATVPLPRVMPSLCSSLHKHTSPSGISRSKPRAEEGTDRTWNMRLSTPVFFYFFSSKGNIFI